MLQDLIFLGDVREGVLGEIALEHLVLRSDATGTGQGSRVSLAERGIYNKPWGENAFQNFGEKLNVLDHIL